MRQDNVDPNAYTEDELKAILIDMQEANKQIYAYMFNQGFGTKCHAFLEFCGLMSKFTDLCREAMQQGKQFPHMNTHSGDAMEIDAHHAAYLAEKFDCIYGPFFKSNPEAARVFARKALGMRFPEDPSHCSECGTVMFENERVDGDGRCEACSAAFSDANHGKE